MACFKELKCHSSKLDFFDPPVDGIAHFGKRKFNSVLKNLFYKHIVEGGIVSKNVIKCTPWNHNFSKVVVKSCIEFICNEFSFFQVVTPTPFSKPKPNKLNEIECR